MVGNATFTIATSRMTMKKAEHNTARPSQRRESAVALAFISYLLSQACRAVGAPSALRPRRQLDVTDS